MDIICRHCNATYTVADHKLPPKKAAAKCKRCGNQIVIDPADAESLRHPTTAPAPLPLPPCMTEVFWRRFLTLQTMPPVITPCPRS